MQCKCYQGRKQKANTESVTLSVSSGGSAVQPKDYTGNEGELSAVYHNSLYFVVKMFLYTENIHILCEYNFTTRVFPTLVGSVLHTSTFPNCCCPYTYPCICGSL